MKMRSIFDGWVVVAVAAFGLLLGAFPIAVFAFGVFFTSFAQYFHAGRGAVSLAFTIMNTISALSGVVIGRLCDRFGPRKVILSGLAILGTVLISAEISGGKLWQLYLFYAALGIVTPATASIPYCLVVSRWFNRRRGLALGVMMAGLGIGAIVMPIVAQQLIAGFGWQKTFAIFGFGIVFLTMPLIFAFLKENPVELELPSDGKSQITTECVSPTSEGMPWQEVWRSGTFWLLVASFVLVAASVHACIIHLPELFADQGATAKTAARASSVLGIAVLVGRVGCGYFLDRFFAPLVASLVFLHAAAGIALLSVGGTGALAFIGAFLVGLGFGAEADIVAYLISRYFGLRSFGTTFGFAFGAFVLAGGLGPLLMGIVFDRTRSYRLALAGFFFAALLGAMIVRRLGPYCFGTENIVCERQARRAEA